MSDGERMQEIFAQGRETAKKHGIHAGGIAAAVAEEEGAETERQRRNGTVEGREERPGDRGRAACDVRVYQELEEAERDPNKLEEEKC